VAWHSSECLDAFGHCRSLKASSKRRKSAPAEARAHKPAQAGPGERGLGRRGQRLRADELAAEALGAGLDLADLATEFK